MIISCQPLTWPQHIFHCGKSYQLSGTYQKQQNSTLNDGRIPSGSTASAKVSKAFQDSSRVSPENISNTNSEDCLISKCSKVSTVYDVPLWRHLSYEVEIKSSGLGYDAPDCPDPAYPLETHPDEEDYRKTICAAGISYCKNTVSSILHLNKVSNLLQNWQTVYGRTQPLILRTQTSAVSSSKIDFGLGNTSWASRFESATTIEEMSTLLHIFYFEFQPLPHNTSIFDSSLPVSMLTTRSYGISTSSTAY